MTWYTMSLSVLVLFGVVSLEAMAPREEAQTNRPFSSPVGPGVSNDERRRWEVARCYCYTRVTTTGARERESGAQGALPVGDNNNDPALHALNGHSSLAPFEDPKR